MTEIEKSLYVYMEFRNTQDSLEELEMHWQRIHKPTFRALAIRQSES